ncbi:MAG: hypothetical protein EOP51_25420, partial [Sphingobacteriales bacterium]
MNLFNKYRNGGLLVAMGIIGFTACNKAPEEILPVPTTPVISSARAIGDTLRLSANDSLFYKIIVRGNMLSTLHDKTKTFTLFSPNNAAVRQFVSGASGGLIPPAGAPEAQYVGFINSSLPVASAASIVQYQTLPQTVKAANIPTTFPNLPYPTLLNPNPAASALLRFDGYVSRRTNGAWLNNIPVNLAERIEVYKGVVPVELGADALGGAVNIITDQHTRKYLDASVSYGSFNTSRAALSGRYTDAKTGLVFDFNGFNNYS